MKITRTLFMLMSVTVLGSLFPFVAVAADDGAKIFAESCSPCHSAKIRSLDNTRLTKEQWTEAVDRMIDQGAEVPRGKKQVLLEYLVSTHGPVSAATETGKK
jgi:cytochrome c1